MNLVRFFFVINGYIHRTHSFLRSCIAFSIFLFHMRYVYNTTIYTLYSCARHHTYTTTQNVREEEFYRKRRREKKRVFGVNREKIWPICLLYHYCKKVHLYFNFNCAKQNKTALKLSILSICVYCGEINQCVMVYESQTFHKNTISIE